MADSIDSSSSGRRGKMSKMPFIMPDGRPLGAYLSESQEKHKGKRRHQREQKKEKKDGWTYRHQKYSSNGKDSSMASYLASHLDDEELDSLNKLGQRRQRRWKNDLLLRAMAPELTADAIDGLFKPVPFGDIHPPSAFTQVADDEHVQQLWHMLLSVTTEKQERILEKWDAHVRDLSKKSDTLQQNNTDRIHANAKTVIGNGYSERWRHKVSAAGKMALRKAPAQTLRDIESKIIQCVVIPEMTVDVYADDGFGRLLAHSIAQFHGLQSKSKTADQGRYVQVSNHDRESHIRPVYIGIADFVFALTDNSELGNLIELQRPFPRDDISLAAL